MAPPQKPMSVVSSPAADTLQLSPTALGEIGLTGRVAFNEKEGNLTDDQAQQLYGQISAIRGQIVTDRQADGDTLPSTDAQAIKQAQVQVSQTVYNEAHNGASAPAGANVPQAAAREAVEAGRIALNVKDGELSNGQAQQLGSQLGAIHQQIASDEQADGGTLSPADEQAIGRLQNQLSQQIHQEAHGAGAEPEG